MSIYSTSQDHLSCRICDKPHHSYVHLAAHIRSHQCTAQIYYDTYLKEENEGICLECGAPTKFVNMNLGYQKWCGMRCSNIEKLRNNWKNPKYQEQRREQMLGNNYSVGRPKGSKNKNPYPMTEAVLNRLELTACNLDWTGKKHKKKTIEKMSQARIAWLEENGLTMPYKGKFRPSHPEKYNGDPTNIIYRSQLELRFMQYLDTNSQVISWESEERIVPYYDPVSEKLRRYFPDFLVTTKKGTTMVEVKPYAQCKPPTSKPHTDGRKNRRYLKEATTYATNQAKWSAAEEYCADRKWQFKIVTEKDLGGW